MSELSKSEIVRLMENSGYIHPGSKAKVDDSGGIVIWGHVRTIKIYPDGTTIEEDFGRNRVVDNGLLCIAHAMSGDGTSSNYKVTDLAVGYSAGASESNTTTALANQLYALGPTVSHGATGVVNFEISVGKDQPWPGPGNTEIINEAGLLATGASPQLITYKVVSPQTVDNTFTLIVRWTLTFARGA